MVHLSDSVTILDANEYLVASFTGQFNHIHPPSLVPLWDVLIREQDVIRLFSQVIKL